MSGTEKSPAPPSDAETRRLRRLSRLAGIELVGTASATEVLGSVVKLVTEVLPCDAASVALWDPIDEELTLGMSTIEDQGPGSVVFQSDGVTRTILESGQPMFVNDPEQLPEGSRRDFGSFIGVPIEAEGQRLGVLYALDVEAGGFEDDDMEFVSVVARRAASAILHARMFEETRSARERSEALAWAASTVIAAHDLSEILSAVVEGIAAAVSADRVYLVTIDTARQRVLEHVVTGMGLESPASYEGLMAGLTGWVMQEGRIAITSGVLPDPRESPEITRRRREIGGGPSVVAPLKSGERVLGTLTVLRPGGRPMFSESEIDLIVAMANQTAVALDYVRLLQTTRSSLRETEAMYTVSQQLIGAESPSDMLEAVSAGAREALPASWVIMVTADLEDRVITDQAVVGSVDKIGSFEELWEGPYGEVLRSGQSLRREIDDDERSADPHALMAVPLRLHDRILGLLVAGHDGASFSDHQLEMVTTLAAQAAVAIENTRLFREVQRLAVTDELTHLHTRRHLFELGEREFQHAVRYRTPLSTIMFDLDHFKAVNDTLGHVVGDEVLRGVAGRCAQVVRAIDVLGRFGGEEFAVVLPKTELSDALVIAERLREVVASDPIETSRGPIAVTISAGVAEIGPGVLELKTLLDRADAAMYEAKRAGRNRVNAA